jgi:hypothetical protein
VVWIGEAGVLRSGTFWWFKVWRDRSGKFERGMFVFGAAGGVRCVQVRSVIGMSRPERR